MGSTLEKLRTFPEEVKDEIGYALRVAQYGNKHHNVKKYQDLSGVMEIVSNFDKEAYRAIYTFKIENYIYVLHVFHKKSKTGKKIPKEIDKIIRQRYKEALNHARTS
jgi:phage-related protein